VIPVGAGARALEAIDSTPAIELVITDQAMPGMTGLQLIEEIRARRPELPVILATGYAELPQTVSASSIARLASPSRNVRLQKRWPQPSTRARG